MPLLKENFTVEMTYTDDGKISLFRNIINHIKKEIILNKPKKSPEEAARVLLNIHMTLTGVLKKKKDLSVLKSNNLEGVFDDIIDNNMTTYLSDNLLHYCTRDLYENPMALEIEHINIQYR